MGSVIHLRFLTLIYLSFLPFHSLAVGPSPDPSPGSSPAAPDTTPSPELPEGPNNAPVQMNICNGDINIYNDCTFYGNPPGANEAHRPAGYVERGGGGGGGGGGGFPDVDNAVTVTVTEYVTKTRIVYLKGPAPPTPQPENEQADAGLAGGSPEPVTEPSESNVEPESPPEPAPEAEAEIETETEPEAGAEPGVGPEADAETGPESNADTDADPDADPSTLDPLNADDVYASKKKTYNEADAFADEFSDPETVDIARHVHQYWSQKRETMCHVCIAVIDKLGREISNEELDKVGEAFGKDRKDFDVVMLKLVRFLPLPSVLTLSLLFFDSFTFSRPHI